MIHGDGGLDGLPVHPSFCLEVATAAACFLAISHSKVLLAGRPTVFLSQHHKKAVSLGPAIYGSFKASLLGDEESPRQASNAKAEAQHGPEEEHIIILWNPADLGSNPITCPSNQL